jgi:hypothetical protein
LRVDHLAAAESYSSMSLKKPAADNSFTEWWQDATEAANVSARQGLNSLIISLLLMLGSFGSTHNHCVFDGAFPYSWLWFRLVRSVRYGRWLGIKAFPSCQPPSLQTRIVPPVVVLLFSFVKNVCVWLRVCGGGCVLFGLLTFFFFLI